MIMRSRRQGLIIAFLLGPSSVKYIVMNLSIVSLVKKNLLIK